jgi:hypothetical protein
VTRVRLEEDSEPEDLTTRLLGGTSSLDEVSTPARLADEWIGQRLKELDYDLGHPECQQLADHLYALGVGTLINLKHAGTIFHKCVELGMRGLPPPPGSWDAEAQRVIIVAVRLATSRFITDSMPQWDSSLSSIDTYFVNYCLFRFKAVYLQYCKEERQVSAEVPTGNVVDLFEARAAQGSVEDLALARQTIREAVQLINDEDFTTLVFLAAAGRTRIQIATVLGVSVSALDRRIVQYRKKLRNNGWLERQVDGS